MKKTNKILAVIIVPVIIIGLFTGIALAASENNDGTIYAAYNLRSGIMRLIKNPDDYNKRSEGVISWNKQGGQSEPGSCDAKTLEDYPVGTQYKCYPSEPFDFISRMQTGWDIDNQIPLYTDISVSISLLKAEFISKNSIEEYNQDPSKGTPSEDVYLYNPYTSRVTITGHADPVNAGKTVQAAVCTNLSSDPCWTEPTSIDENGNFEITQEMYWNSPVTVWFSGIRIFSMM